jgi:hypothetical protein
MAYSVSSFMENTAGLRQAAAALSVLLLSAAKADSAGGI